MQARLNKKAKGNNTNCCNSEIWMWQLPGNTTAENSAILLVTKKIRGAGCSWATAQNGGNYNLSAVFLRSNGKRANGQRFFASQVISSYSLASLYFVKVLEFLSSGDCPSHASTCYGKTTLLFTLLWLSTKVSSFYQAVTFHTGSLLEICDSCHCKLVALVLCQGLAILYVILNSVQNLAKIKHREFYCPPTDRGAHWISSHFLLTTQATVIFRSYGTSCLQHSLPDSE